MTKKLSGILAAVSTPFTKTGEVDEARRNRGVAVEEVLLAALGRTLAGAAGSGVAASTAPPVSTSFQLPSATAALSVSPGAM